MDEITIPYEFKKGNKIRKLTITKGAPIYKKIELEFLDNRKKLQAVAYIPIKVGPGKSPISKFISLSLKDQKEIDSQVHDVKVKLLVHHNWAYEDLEKYLATHGTKGLIKEYQKLEKNSK